MGHGQDHPERPGMAGCSAHTGRVGPPPHPDGLAPTPQGWGLRQRTKPRARQGRSWWAPRSLKTLSTLGHMLTTLGSPGPQPSPAHSHLPGSSYVGIQLAVPSPEPPALPAHPKPSQTHKPPGSLWVGGLHRWQGAEEVERERCVCVSVPRSPGPGSHYSSWTVSE